MALVSNIEFYNNSAGSKGGGMVYDWANHVKNCLFEVNDATAGGGAGFIHQQSLYQYNAAEDEDGLCKAFLDDID